MIDIERIEKAYHRFHKLYNQLHHRAQKIPETKDEAKKGWNIYNHNLGITISFYGENAEKEADTLVQRINAAVEPFLNEEYNRLLDELDKSNE